MAGIVSHNAIPLHADLPEIQYASLRKVSDYNVSIVFVVQYIISVRLSGHQDHPIYLPNLSPLHSGRHSGPGTAAPGVILTQQQPGIAIYVY